MAVRQPLCFSLYNVSRGMWFFALTLRWSGFSFSFWHKCIGGVSIQYLAIDIHRYDSLVSGFAVFGPDKNIQQGQCFPVIEEHWWRSTQGASF